MRARTSGRSSIGQRNAFHSKSCRSSQTSRSSSARSYAPSLLQRTRYCGGATTEIGSSCRKPRWRTVSRTLVAEPSSSCARTAIRRASSIVTSRALDTLEAGYAGGAARGFLQLRVDVAAALRLRREAANAQDPFGPVRLHVGAADEAVAGEERQDVVAVLPLVLALVDLDHVLEAEQALEQWAVPHEVVERADEHRRRGVGVELRACEHVEGRPGVGGVQ